MCTGVEIAGIVSAAASTAAAVHSMSQKPTASLSDPAADAAKARDQAAQEAAKASLDARRRSRANSLLSSYAADDSAGKATLGA